MGHPETTTDKNISALFWQALSVIGVNVFVLVTGYFSTFPKIKSLANICFICLFYAFIRVLIGFLTHSLNYETFFFISKSNWFVTAYLGLVLLTPALNYCAEQMSQKSFGTMVAILLAFEVWFGFIPGYGSQHFSDGYSILSFAILYLVGRYIKLYGVPNFMKRWSGLLYLACTILISGFAYCLLVLGWRTDIMIPTFYEYTNPLIILSAVCFLVFFTNLNIKQSKIINHLGKSTLAVLLIHTSEPFTSWRKMLFADLLHDYSGLTLFVLWVSAIMLVFALCCLADQVRLLAWRPIQNHLNNIVKRNELY